MSNYSEIILDENEKDRFDHEDGISVKTSNYSMTHSDKATNWIELDIAYYDDYDNYGDYDDYGDYDNYDDDEFYNRISHYEEFI